MGSQGFQPWEPWLYSLASVEEGSQLVLLPNLRCDIRKRKLDIAI